MKNLTGVYLKENIKANNGKKVKHFYWLDLIRFIAAFIVMATHARGSFFVEYSLLPESQHNPLVFCFYFLTRLGFESVLIFFVLSGFLVGGKAIIKISQGTFNIKRYSVDRFARIMLPLISALLFYLPICIIFNFPISFNVWIGNLLCLQGILTGFVFGPLWSLSYEVWFYILTFGFAIIWLKPMQNKKWFLGIFIFFVSLLVFIKLNSTLLFVWLLGAFVFSKFPKLSHSSRIWGLFISAALCVGFVILLQISSGSHSVSFIDDDNAAKIHNYLSLLLGLCFAIFLRVIIGFIPENKLLIVINEIGSKLAAFSYTMYLVHIPVFRMLEALGAPKCASLSLYSISLYMVWIAIAMIISYVLYLIFERNTPILKKWLMLHLSKPC